MPATSPKGLPEVPIREFIHFLVIAPGSIVELETQYTLAQELGLTEGSKTVEKPIQDARKMTIGLIKHLKNK